MPSISIENGKRIEELLEIAKISASSFFLVSDNDLTRKITLTNLRNAFCGDTSTENLNNVFFSVEKINELLDHIYDDISKINTKMDSFEDRINNMYNDIGAELSEFIKKVESMYAELKLADSNLQASINNTKTELTNLINSKYDDMSELIDQVKNELNQTIQSTKTELSNKIDTVNSNLVQKITQVESTLNSKITSTKTELQQSINNVNTTLGNRITAVENKLANITGIQYGTSVPSNLATGTIYLQYF